MTPRQLESFVDELVKIANEMPPEGAPPLPADPFEFEPRFDNTPRYVTWPKFKRALLNLVPLSVGAGVGYAISKTMERYVRRPHVLPRLHAYFAKHPVQKKIFTYGAPIVVTALGAAAAYAANKKLQEYYDRIEGRNEQPKRINSKLGPSR